MILQSGQFLEDVARHLDTEIRRGATKNLIIVAAPRALGMLRPAYSATVRQALRAEIDKDWVKTPIYEIEKRLLG